MYALASHQTASRSEVTFSPHWRAHTIHNRFQWARAWNGPKFLLCRIAGAFISHSFMLNVTYVCVCVCHIFWKLRFGARLSQSNRDKVEPPRRNVRRTERKIPTARKLFPYFHQLRPVAFGVVPYNTNDDDVDSANERSTADAHNKNEN